MIARNTALFLAFGLALSASFGPFGCGLDSGGMGDPQSSGDPSHGGDSVGATDIGGAGNLPGAPVFGNGSESPDASTDAGAADADAAATDAAKPAPIGDKGPGKDDGRDH